MENMPEIACDQIFINIFRKWFITLTCIVLLYLCAFHGVACREFQKSISANQTTIYWSKKKQNLRFDLTNV